MNQSNQTNINYYAVYESSYGYNTTTRLGKIYKFSCRGVAIYMCSVNPDLRDVSFWLRHFVRIARYRSRLNKAIRLITPKDLMERELGIINLYGILKRKGIHVFY